MKDAKNVTITDSDGWLREQFGQWDMRLVVN
ncbi:Protein of unknown function [Lactobacillus delbrueckii subsp. bulgaricus]|nr:Protein of unknown function [Lactobacillus delbrueckii subsp. bulgaricus]CDR75058.1 Protein of unknown function [Lactobacillus delbrueckii subsp. bulgaricus]